MEIRIPKTLADVTVGKFIRLLEIEKSDLEEHERNLMAISCLTGLSERQLDDLDLSVYHKAVAVINSYSLDSLPKVVKPKLIINHRTFIPATDFKDWKAGQYIDLQTFMKTEPIMNLHRIIATVVVEEELTYQAEDHQEKAQLIHDHLTVGDAYPVALFFSQVLTNSISLIRTSSKKRMIRMISRELSSRRKRKRWRNFKRIGAGIWSLTFWREVITSAGKKLQICR